jgi:hypothetical protein
MNIKGILSFALILFTINIFACNCAENTVKDSFNNSNIIFTGELIKKDLLIKEIEAPKIKTLQKYVTYQYTFKIITNFKGNKSTKEITISSRYKDFNFKVGKAYLVYAYFSEYLLTNNFYLNGERVNPFLASDICTRTKSLSVTESRELKKLKSISKRYFRRLA